MRPGTSFSSSTAVTSAAGCPSKRTSNVADPRHTSASSSAFTRTSFGVCHSAGANTSTVGSEASFRSGSLPFLTEVAVTITVTPAHGSCDSATLKVSPLPSGTGNSSGSMSSSTVSSSDSATESCSGGIPEALSPIVAVSLHTSWSCRASMTTLCGVDQSSGVKVSVLTTGCKSRSRPGLDTPTDTALHGWYVSATVATVFLSPSETVLARLMTCSRWASLSASVAVTSTGTPPRGWMRSVVLP